MHAFHSNWTGPYFKKQPNQPYEIEDFELLTTILSALKWQEKNGDIEMITDHVGAEYYRTLGLSSLWNKGISEALENVDKGLDPSTFWAAGKLYALAEQTEPCVMIDTDFIVWEDLRDEMMKHDVTVIHRENIDPAVYPTKEVLKVSKEYDYPLKWNWQVLPCNTAFTFFNQLTFKDYYVEEAFRFMQAVKDSDPLIYMVFTEQRLLAMCAEEKKIDLYTFATTQALFHSHQTSFTHIWGHKRYLRSHECARYAFCKRCLNRIEKDFPAFYPIVTEIEVLKKYI